MAVEEIERFVAGEALRNVADRQALLARAGSGTAR